MELKDLGGEMKQEDAQVPAADGAPVERGVGRAVVAALVLVCAGCSVGERTDAETPKGWRTFVAFGNHVTHVVPVTMEDGTRCVVTFGNGAGRGVSCEWPSAK